MSLEIGKPKDSIIIAGKYNNVDKKCMFTKNSKHMGYVSYLPEDEFEVPKGERLKRLRLNLKSEIFFPEINDFFSNEQVDSSYITGMKGCGKTTYVHNYAILFHRKYPKAKIYFFSSKKEDEKIDILTFIERVEIDENYLLNPMTIEEIHKNSNVSLCIFDDVQDFKEKKITDEIGRFRDELLRNGRSKGIYMLCVFHNPCSYTKTRDQLFECNKIIIFPKRCKKGTYNYLMQKKLNLSNATMKLLNELNSNFVCIDQGPIPTIISDKYIILDK